MTAFGYPPLPPPTLPPPPVGVRRGVAVTLGIAIVVLLAAAALLVSLYLNKRADAAAAADRLTAVEQTLSDAGETLADHQSTVDDLDARHQQLTDDNATLHACADPAKEAVAAAQAGDQDALSAALDKMFANCNVGELT